MNALVLQRTVADLIAEYEAKDGALADELAAFEAATPRIEMATTVQGTYVGPVLDGRGHWVHLSALRKHLLKSGWKAVYNRCNTDRIASAADKRKFEMQLADLKGEWTDLPAASFSEAETNVPTGFLVVKVKV